MSTLSFYIPRKTITTFQRNLLRWYNKNKRDLPWRYSKDPYQVLVSEILLQKTDAPKVIPIYESFISRYPDLNKLHSANLSDVKAILKGLGLFYRAQRLISIAKYLSIQYEGKVPSRIDQLIKMKGIGKYVASAVLCFAFNRSEPLVDNNIVRLFQRIFGYESPKKRPRDDPSLWYLAKSFLPRKNVRDYNYALLDFSALVCIARNPKHDICPLKSICKYYRGKIGQRNPAGIDLFAGAGGLSLGFEKAGFDILYAIENDKYAAETYGQNRKTSSVIVDGRDINEVSPKEILQKLRLKAGELDIIIGGPPCQGFSTSNMKTRHLNNPQNRMVFKFIDFIKTLSPRWFLMENVAGLDSFEQGSVRNLLNAMFRDLGYTTECLILNSLNFGIPQSRKRIYFIGNRVGDTMVFIERLRKKIITKPVTVLETISDLPHLKTGNPIDYLPYKRDGNLTKYQVAMRSGTDGKVANNLVSSNTELVIERFRHIRQGENLLKLARRAPHLVTNYKNIEKCHHWIYLRLAWNRPSVTLNNFRKNMLIHPTQHRGLSVREAARLQSFPDQYIFYGPLNSQQQQVANSVPPILAQKIATEISELIGRRHE
jgi:DNA (cytosine-5)-methyltransferase 1